MDDLNRLKCKVLIKQTPTDLSHFSQLMLEYIKSVFNPNSWDKIGLSFSSYQSENRVWISYRRVHALKAEDIVRAIMFVNEVDPDLLTKGDMTI
jgi:hypothetical protein